MKSKIYNMLGKVKIIIDMTLDEAWKDLECQIGREIGSDEPMAIFDVYRNAIDRSETQVLESFKKTYLDREDSVLALDVINTIEHNQGKGILEIYKAIKATTDDEIVNMICDTVLGIKDHECEEDVFTTITKYSNDILMFIKVYNYRNFEAIQNYLSSLNDNTYKKEK